MKLKSRSDVLNLLYDKWDARTGTETVPLEEAVGRILAEDVSAAYSIPVVRASAMDGVAVRSAAFADGMPDTAAWVRGVDYERADTGDDFPDEFDAVIAIEQVTLLTDGGIRLNEDIEVEPGYNVRPSGSTLQTGEPMLFSGTRLRAEHLALAAMAGRDALLVRKKPVIAFIPTGSELVPAGSALARGQNFNSNGTMARAMITDMGGEPIIYPIARDDRPTLEAALQDALTKADVVVLSGGSSKGEEDFSTHILQEQGELICDGVAAVPGRPMTLVLMDGKPVVNTSGPAFACFYNLDWCIRALICSLLNVAYTQRHKVTARLKDDLYTPPMMEMLVRMHVYRTRSGYVAEPVQRGFSSIADMFNSNALLVSAIGSDHIPAGAQIEVELCCTPDEIPTVG